MGVLRHIGTCLLALTVTSGLAACDDGGESTGSGGGGGALGGAGGDGGAPGGAGGQGGGGAGGTPEPAGEFVASALSRNHEPAVPAGDLSALVDGEVAFTLDLYGQLAAEEGNLFYSPFSVHQALAMTWAGARGQTEAQMADALHFDLDQARLHPAQNALDLALASRAETEPQDGGEPLALEIANSVWGREGYAWEQAFLDVLAEHYGAGLRQLDFIGDPEAARERINDWVEEKTHDRIQDLIPEGVIDSSTVMVLVNAIFFKASWADPFDPDNTVDGDFTLPGGETVPVPMMRHPLMAGRHGAGEGWVAAALPYAGHETSMLVVVPDDLAAFEAGLDAARYRDITDALAPADLDVRLPRWEFESKFSLNEVMQALGMTDAFTGAADFSGMNGVGGLFIQAIIHQAFVKVDEEGTEAAAATAVVVGETSVPTPVEFFVDRPFVFFIRDDLTGAVLFAGRVLDPR